MEVLVRRLGAEDAELAQGLFALMSAVFGEPHRPLGHHYLEGLLASQGFWAMAAFSGGELLGGLTAHSLPMTRVEAAEVFVYDLAVQERHQGQGVGRALVAALREHCGAQGIHVVFVSADDEDVHALEFYKAIGGTPSPVTFFTFDDG